MNDRECIELLKWALPRMQLCWRGFRRVRRQVCKRVTRRLIELELADATAYRELLERRPEEWRHLEGLCAITISRFWRDPLVFEGLCAEVLPALAERARCRGDKALRCWSAGCASGEEPYSLSMTWERRVRRRYPSLALQIVATDRDPAMIERARDGRYPASSLRSIPSGGQETDFTREGELLRIQDVHRRAIDFRAQDIRTVMPDGPFDLILCRNLVFTYFQEQLQRRILEGICGRLHLGGALVLGSHESLPEGALGWTAWPGCRCTLRYEGDSPAAG